jgi:hypothetical protein
MIPNPRRINPKVDAARFARAQRRVLWLMGNAAEGPASGLGTEPPAEKEPEEEEEPAPAPAPLPERSVEPTARPEPLDTPEPGTETTPPPTPRTGNETTGRDRL